MVDLKQYEEAYNRRQREFLDAAIELALAKQGIDPERVPKRDFDQIRRLNIKLNDINAKAQAHIAKVQQMWRPQGNTPPRGRGLSQVAKLKLIEQRDKNEEKGLPEWLLLNREYSRDVLYNLFII